MMFVASVHRLSAAAPLATPTRGASRYRRSAAPRPVVALDGNQLEAALEHQLRRSREAQAAAEPKAQPAQSAVPARKASRREEAAAAEAAEVRSAPTSAGCRPCAHRLWDAGARHGAEGCRDAEESRGSQRRLH